MKFGVLADIHGNAKALKAVLDRLASLQIEELYCVGDLIGIGHESNEVCELLLGKPTIHIVTGNHDEAIVALFKGEEHPKNHAHVYAHHLWLMERMEPYYLEQLANLPRTIEKGIGAYQFLFTHYGLKPGLAAAPIAQSPFSSIVEPTYHNMETLFGNEYDAVFFGHHHPRHHFQSERLYVNPGALGCQPLNEAPFAIVEVNERIEVMHSFVNYERDAFLQQFKETDIPEKETILRIFYGEKV